MCEQGTYESVKIGEVMLNTIDACIAPIVQALNDAGIETIASCCGHGKIFGSIVLKDKREILIVNNYHETRLLESIYLGDIERVKKVMEDWYGINNQTRQS